MSSPPTAPGALFRLRVWLSTPAGIITLFVIGLVIRLALSGSHGFPTDMSAFKAWGGRLAERGPWNFYPRDGEEYFVDYPPGYLYVLWVVGLAARMVGDGGIPDLWVKIPPIRADLGLAWVVMTAAHRLSPVAVVKRVPVRAMAAAAILLNPAIIFISAVWGQADSVVTLLVAAGLLLLGTGPPTLRREAAGMVLIAFALGTKPQAVFVIPVVVLVLCWRHVWLRSQEAPEPEFRRRDGWRGLAHVALLGACGVVGGFVMFAPFRMFPARALEFYTEASRTYKVTSVFAFNLWGAIDFWRPDSGKDAVELFGVPAVVVGIVLFLAIGVLVLGRAWVALRNGVDQGRVLVFGSMALTLVGFAVVTRIHERYLFLPLALGAMLVSHRMLRRAFIVLSVLYLVNVYFPYVYYLDREGLGAPKLWGLYDVLYGNDISGGEMKILSALITVACLAIVALGWRALEATPPEAEVIGPVEEPVDQERPPLRFELHAIGRRRALIALAVFAVAFASRVIGLGHPPGMYFDEVYHARTGAEYLTGKEVFEYTHPPLAKETMGFAIQHLSGFKTTDGGPLAGGVDPATVVPRPNGVAWVRNGANGSSVQLGRINAACDPMTISTLADLDLHGEGLVITKTGALVAGESDVGPVLVRIEGGAEQWRATLPSGVKDIDAVGDRAFVVTSDGELVTVSPEGKPDTLAIGASSVAANDTEAWVAFPGEQQIASWDAERKRTAEIEVDGAPDAMVVPENVERVFVSISDRVVSYDTETKAEHVTIPGGADLLGAIPETTIVWAVDGRAARAIEPHSGSVIGEATFDRAPELLSADVESHRLLGIAEGHLECASGRPQFAWRLGSAIAGAAMIAMIFLLALRLFGNLSVGLLSALFLTVDGLAFTISRIAMNDSYATAFILAAWFCVLSAMHTRDRERPPWIAIAWIGAAGVAAGLGVASKWPGLYAIAGIGLLLLWDGFERRERSLWRVAGGFLPSAGVLAVLLGVVPIAIYVATYIPYFQLGHDFGDLLELQKRMYDYHSQLTATHPFGSPWYGWPFGYRAVFLYLSGEGSSRSEIWTIPNLVVIWGGLIAMAAAVRGIFKDRNAVLGVVLLGAAIQYVPWMLVTRVTFMYHYLPVVPWLALALAWFLVDGLRGWKHRKTAIVAVSVAAVATFAFLYPILVGWEMPVSYLDLVRELFPWVI